MTQQQPPSSPAPVPGKNVGLGIALGALCVGLACMVLRCIVSFDPFPYWSGDPFLLESPVVGLTPAWAIALDCLIPLSSVAMAFGLLGDVRRTQPPIAQATVQVVSLLFLGVAMLWIIALDLARQERSLDGTLITLHWACAANLAAMCWCALRAPRLRAPASLLIASACLGLVLAIVPKGIGQVFVEHPQTIRAFRANQDAFLMAQGWSPDSALARGYIRRLEQPEASGWFGLANVFATFAAAGVGMFAYWVLHEIRVLRERASLVSREDTTDTTKILTFAGVGLALSAAGVYLAGSKGGYAVAALSLGLACAGAWVRGASRESAWAVPRRLALALGPALVGLALLAVVVRGLLGERLGELSLLFRWFYMQGAARIFLENPMSGVGGAGFKDGYMLHKPALSPEDTAYAHSVLIDWIVAFGVLGFVFVLVWLIALSVAGLGLLRDARCNGPASDEASRFGSTPALLPSNPSHQSIIAHDELLRAARGVALLLFIAPTACAALIERAAATPDAGLIRAAGIALVLALSWALHRSLLREKDPCTLLGPMLSIGALTAGVHAQIELTGTTQGSAAWCLVLIASGAGLARWPFSGTPRLETQPHEPEVHAKPAKARSRLMHLGMWVLVFVPMIFVVPMWMLARTALRWEHALQDAYEPASRFRDLAQQRRSLATLSPAERLARTQALAQDLALALGKPVGVDGPSLDVALQELQGRAIIDARTHLAQASDIQPNHFATLRAASRMAMADVQARIARSEPVSEQQANEPVAFMHARTKPFQHQATYWSWLGTITRERALLPYASSTTQSTRQLLEEASQAWQQAAKLAPHDPVHAVKLSDLHAQMALDSAQPEDLNQSRRWAQVALRLNANLRLDPLRQLTPEEVRRLEAR